MNRRYHEAYWQAMYRAEYYRWAANRGFACCGGDPLTGRKKSDFVSQDRREGRAANIALAKFWLQEAAAIRQLMREERGQNTIAKCA